MGRRADTASTGTSGLLVGDLRVRAMAETPALDEVRTAAQNYPGKGSHCDSRLGARKDAQLVPKIDAIDVTKPSPD